MFFTTLCCSAPGFRVGKKEMHSCSQASFSSQGPGRSHHTLIYAAWTEECSQGVSHCYWAAQRRTHKHGACWRGGENSLNQLWKEGPPFKTSTSGWANASFHRGVQGMLGKDTETVFSGCLAWGAWHREGPEERGPCLSAWALLHVWASGQRSVSFS